MTTKRNTRYLWGIIALRDKARARGDTAIYKALDRLIRDKKNARVVSTGGGRETTVRDENGEIFKDVNHVYLTTS